MMSGAQSYFQSIISSKICWDRQTILWYILNIWNIWKMSTFVERILFKSVPSFPTEAWEAEPTKEAHIYMTCIKQSDKPTQGSCAFNFWKMFQGYFQKFTKSSRISFLYCHQCDIANGYSIIQGFIPLAKCLLQSSPLIDRYLHGIKISIKKSIFKY